jgi:methyl-accepting chemotaxis protein
MRSDSRFSEESTILKQKIDTVTANKALDGQVGVEVTLDSRGVPVLSAFKPLHIEGLKWVLMSEIDEAEAFVAARRMLTVILIIMAAVGLLVAGVALFIANSIAGPIMMVAEGAKRLSTGDAELAGMDWKKIDKINARQDELGVTGRSFAALIEYFTEMAAAAQRIAAGDLTAEVQPRAEVDLLGNAFKQMTTNLHQLVGHVTDTANGVGAASEQLAAVSSQASQAAAQVATNIQQVAAGTAQQTEEATRASTIVEQVDRAIDGVARGAQEQAVAVGKSSEITEQISTAIEQVATNAQAGAEGAAQAAQAARTGTQTVEETIQSMNNIKAKVGLSVQKVQEMGLRSDQIGVIVETIDDIASQTNLLALNAAIEAARAGEHGKGFAVVADEVRKLAEKSTTATDEIATLIKGIQQTVAEAVAAMDEGAAKVEVGVTRANQAGESLVNILQASEAVNQQVEQIAAAAQQMTASAAGLMTAMDTVSAVVEENTASTEEMAASSGEVARAIEGVASVSEENNAATEEVSASTEEMNAQVEEVTASAQSLSAMAQELQAIVAQFKLDKEDGNGAQKAVYPAQTPEVPVPEPVESVPAAAGESNGRQPQAVIPDGQQ